MRVLKHRNKLLAFIFGIFLFSCEEPFTPDIEIDGYTNMLVVEGLITNEVGPFRVHLSSTISLDTTISTLPVYGALVEIYDDHGNSYTLQERSDGWYQTTSLNLKAELGVNYTLSVLTQDGVQYESSPVEMVNGPEIEKLHFKESLYTNFNKVPPKDEKLLDILIDTKGETNETSFVKWEFEETWEINIPNEIEVVDGRGNITNNVVKPNNEMRNCWMSVNSNSIKVESTEHLEVNEIINFPLKSIAPEGNRLDIKYSILVKQYSMNKELYTFWSTLKEYNEDLGSMFDKTPSSIYGNIICCDNNKKALGYFMVSDVKQKRIFIDRSQHTVRSNTGYEACLYTDFKPDEFHIFFGKTLESNRNIYNPIEWCVDCKIHGTNVKPPFWE
ncbi:MAG: DUF4249 domain-containing protein [Bacteroidetes bacterium]|nr:DUF4249 domain-containing protein [Bacteroidota bacterium]